MSELRDFSQSQPDRFSKKEIFVPHQFAEKSTTAVPVDTSFLNWESSATSNTDIVYPILLKISVLFM